MSDSKHSTVTYTSVPFLVEDDSDIGSPGVDGPPIMPEDPYAYIMAAYEEPQSPPPLDFVPEPMYPEYMPQEDEILPAEEQPIPAAAASPTANSPGYVPESDPEEDDKDPEDDPADYPADGDDDDDDEDEDEDKYEEEEEEHPALAGLLSFMYSVMTKIPSLPPNSPTHIEIPESCLPLQKRVRFASPTPSHEVGESSAVGAIDEIAPTTLEGVNQRVTDLATIVEEETTIMYGIMEDAQDDRSQLRGQVNLLYRDTPVHRRLTVMIEREAKMACEAWGLSMDASNYARSDVMSLRTTVVAQSALISELQSADHRRQRVISELLASDHKRQVQLTKTLRLLKGLQTQMVEFQRQHGPLLKRPHSDAPGELSSMHGQISYVYLTRNALTWWKSIVKTTYSEADHAMPWRT
ncbi:hypothetical protein Tco_0359421 [Tanacetum coccineum]